MKRNDTFWGVFSPPIGLEWSETQCGFMGKELLWRVCWTDPDRKGHWMVAPADSSALPSGLPTGNTVSTAYVNQITPLVEAPYQVTQQDLDMIDTRLSKIMEERSELIKQLERKSLPEEYPDIIEREPVREQIEEYDEEDQSIREALIHIRNLTEALLSRLK